MFSDAKIFFLDVVTIFLAARFSSWHKNFLLAQRKKYLVARQ